MSDINVGFVRTGYGLDLASLKRDISALRGLTRDMAAEQANQTKLMMENVAAIREQYNQKEIANAQKRTRQLLKEEAKLAADRAKETAKVLAAIEKAAAQEVATEDAKQKKIAAEREKYSQWWVSALAAEERRVAALAEKETADRIAADQAAAKAHVEAVLKSEAAVKAAIAKETADYEKEAAARLAIFEKELKAEVAAAQAQAAKLAAVQKKATAEKWKAAGQVGRMAGNAGFAVGVPLAVGLAAATKTAAEFDQSMRNVDSIAHLTEQQLAALRAETLKLAQDKSIRQTPKDLAEGLYQVYSAGKSGKEGLEILEWGAKGASAGMTDTATSTKVLLAVLNSGISGVNNAREAMDVLFQEVNLGVNTFPELANSIGNVLPTAKVVGVSLQEVAAAMAQMTRNGINADESVTALNQLLTHIWKPGKEAEKLMTSLGISFGAAALEGKGLGGWLKEVMEKTHGNRDQLAHLIPEIRGAKGEFSLLSDGLKGYNELLKGMQTASDGAGQTTEALTRQNKGARAQFELLQKEVDLTKIAIGEGLLPVVNDGIKRFREWLEEWNKQPQAAKNAQTGMALFAAEVGLGIGVVTSMISAAAKLRTALVTLRLTGAATFAGLAALPTVWMVKAAMDNEVAEGEAKKSQQQASAMPYFPSLKKADELRRKLRSSEEATKRGDISVGGTLLIGGKTLHRMTEEEEKATKAEYARLMAITKKENDAYQKHLEQNNPALAAERARAKTERAAQDALKNAMKSPWGAGGYDRNAGKGAANAARDAAREREQALKDAAREAADERKQLEQLTEELKRLSLAGYALQQFNAQTQFFQSVGETKSQQNKQAAGALYVAQVQKAQAELLRAQGQKALDGMAGFDAPDGQRYGQQLRERGWGLVTQGMGNAYASQQYANQMAEAVAKEIEEQKRAQDEIMEYRRKIGEITNADYIRFLQERVQAERTYTYGGKETSEQNPEFRAKNMELREHYKEALEGVFGDKGRKGGKEASKEIAEGLSQGNQYLKRAMEDLSGGALGSLQKAMKKGMKGGFGDILAHTLSDLLSGVLENAITSMFKKKKKKGGAGDVFGGGGLLGNFLSPLSSLFNFDVASNDRMARHYGYDFANMFTMGMADFKAPQARFAVSSSSRSAPVVHIHMGTNHVREEADIGKIADAVARRVQQQGYGTR